MTDLLDHAVATTRELSPKVQDRIARIMLAAAEDERPIYRLTSEEREGLAKGREQAARGEFASDEDMKALWDEFGVDG